MNLCSSSVGQTMPSQQWQQGSLIDRRGTSSDASQGGEEVPRFLLKSGGIGLVMGALGGLVGIGGGVIAVPLMSHFLRVSQHKATGTSLAAVTSAAIVGAGNYYVFGDGSIDFIAALVIAPSAALCAPLGVRWVYLSLGSSRLTQREAYVTTQLLDSSS